jgi:hypothetical protein
VIKMKVLKYIILAAALTTTLMAADCEINTGKQLPHSGDTGTQDSGSDSAE